MMQVELRIWTVYGHPIGGQGGVRFSHCHEPHGMAVVPTPYQAGDTPSEILAERYGVKHLVLQYGNQPRW